MGRLCYSLFYFNVTATTEIYTYGHTLALHDALPISALTLAGIAAAFGVAACCALPILLASAGIGAAWLSGVAVVSAPYRTPLLVIGADRKSTRLNSSH